VQKVKSLFPNQPSLILRLKGLYLNRADSLVGKSLISMTDQGALSLTNFLVNIILLKTISIADYGRYSFFYSILMLLAAMSSALINSPMNVMIAGKKTSSGNQYISALLFGQVFVFLVFAVLGFAGALLMQFFGHLDYGLWSITVLFLAGLATILREFFKPVFFNRPRPEYVLFIDLTFIFVYLLALFISLQNLNWVSVYGFRFIASTTAGALGIYFWRSRFSSPSFKEIFSSLKENFEHGRWILPNVIVSNLANYSFVYLLIYLLGEAEAGVASGARLVVMPLILCLDSWAKVAVPHGSNLREKKQVSELGKMLFKTSGVFMLGIILYGCFTYLFADDISGFLFDEQRLNQTGLIYLWVIYAFVFVLRKNATVGLMVLKSFKLLFYLNPILVFSTLFFGFIFINSFGVAGSILAMIAVEIGLGIITWVLFIKEKRKFAFNKQ